METSVLHAKKKKRNGREKNFEMQTIKSKDLLQSIESLEKACRPEGVVLGSAARQI
jgi:hypothetical protein